MNAEMSPYFEVVMNIGRKGHVIYIGRIPISVRTSDFDLSMNGRPLRPQELYSTDSIVYKGEVYTAHPDENGLHVPAIDAIVPRSVLDNVHDHVYLLHCLQEGVHPSTDALINFPNREEIRGITEASH